MVVQGTRGNAWRDGPWKLVLCPGSGSAGGFFTEPHSDAAWKAAIEEFGRKPADHAELEQPPFLQLFHLAEDPGETTNLAARHPDRVKRMIGDLRDVIRHGRSTPGPGLKNDREMEVFDPVPGFVWK
jgi:arylsulfatase A